MIASVPDTEHEPLIDRTQLDLVENSTATDQAATSPVAESENADEADEAAAPAAASTDADDDIRQVSHAEASAYARECGLLFFEASAKTGANVGEVFTEIGTS